MKRGIGWLWIIGFFGSLVAADAQAPLPSPAGAANDGKYQFVSATKVNETYTTRAGRLGRCGDARSVGPLTIVNGQARYSNGRRYQFEGTVGPRGELAMRLVPTPGNKNTPGIEIIASGSVGGNGAVRARQSGNLCSYDLVWRKEPR
jgi:hypothetical protein